MGSTKVTVTLFLITLLVSSTFVAILRIPPEAEAATLLTLTLTGWSPTAISISWGERSYAGGIGINVLEGWFPKQS